MATFGKNKKTGKHFARIRLAGHEAYKCGFDHRTDAKEWANIQEGLYKNASRGTMKGMGPQKTMLGVALRDYAYDVLVTQKGCVQALCRVNKYLRAAGLPVLRATLVRGGRTFGTDDAGTPQASKQKIEQTLYKLEEVSSTPVFQAPQQAAFAQRSSDNAARDAAPQAVREDLARMPVSDIRGFNLTKVMTAMLESAYAGATRRQEIAILSGFFEHAMKNWNWPLAANPALAVKWPTGDKRDRVLSKEEAKRLGVALANCRNKPFQIFLLFAMETAMRRGEMLWTACWCDIDRNQEDGDVLKLFDAKKGSREVPLTPFALQLLGELPQGAPHERIFPMTESALSCAWSRVCEVAAIVDLHIHDLRHTAATMFADLFNGDIFTLQQVTGIKSLEILRIYVNPKSRDVSKRMRNLPGATIAQGLHQEISAAPMPVKRHRVVPESASNAAVGTCVVYSSQAFAEARARRRA
ncbi:site-specific integrase [Polaromonas sp.]|jgi:integrase|uniref:tyrosine-type recombinase/integrase n=1 Tax=Polaromonas sp. TaxID=1869339 RepID=UPI0018281A9F|nr:site-specific integrase [Polaromonas sp.]NMM06950.1 site-specific integrase [Polaromonas sp.]